MLYLSNVPLSNVKKQELNKKKSGLVAYLTCKHRLSRDMSASKGNLHPWQTPRDDFGFLDWNIYFY